MESKKLYLYFETEGGNDISIVVDEPDRNLRSSEIKTAMDNLITQGALTNIKREVITKAKSARIVTRTVNEMDIE